MFRRILSTAFLVFLLALPTMAFAGKLVFVCGNLDDPLIAQAVKAGNNALNDFKGYTRIPQVTLEMQLGKSPTAKTIEDALALGKRIKADSMIWFQGFGGFQTELRATRIDMKSGGATYATGFLREAHKRLQVLPAKGMVIALMEGRSNLKLLSHTIIR